MDEFGKMGKDEGGCRLPKRKRNRLKDFDYRQTGMYFITVCTKGRCGILGQIIADDKNNVGAAFCRPTEVGEIVKQEILGIARVYSNVVVDNYVIMPNHVHMLVSITNSSGHEETEVSGRQDAAPTISRIINQWKRAVSMKTGGSVWQKSFYDHVIRNEKDYLQTAEYIVNNPALWYEDQYYCYAK